jgi:acyl carrier protein
LQEREDLVANLKELIVRTLRLEDVSLEDVVASEPLFGEGLGLDSIDALELVVAIEREYQVEIPDAEVGQRAFASINALADFVLESGVGQKASDAVG